MASTEKKKTFQIINETTEVFEIHVCLLTLNQIKFSNWGK